MSDIKHVALHYFDQMKWQPIWVMPDTSVSYPWRKQGLLDRTGIEREFDAHPNYRIAILTGAASNIVVIDPDHKNGAKNGLANLAELIAKNGNEWPETLTATTKTGGKHYVFQHPGNGAYVKSHSLPGCSDVDVKGDGGNIKVFPTPGYTWDNPAVPPAPMPTWLFKIVTSPAKAPNDKSVVPSPDPLSAHELAMALNRCEKYLFGSDRIDPDLPEPEWRMVGASIHQMTRAAPEGLALFDRWSAKGGKYDANAVQQKWKHFELDRPEGAVGENYLGKLNPNANFLINPPPITSLPIPSPQLHPEPIDLFGSFAPPSLPGDLLPTIIEQYARVQSEMMGVDAGGVAMAALAVCSAAIPDSITLRVKRHDEWYESARLWVALVGEPSSKKTPIISKAARPLKLIDARLYGEFAAAKSTFEALPKDEKATAPLPKMRRVRIEDTTVEAVQEILKDNENGVLCIQDELSGWFGGMDKYSGARGGAKDRAFWLQSFNGGSFVVDRISRGTGYVPNLSVTLLGGIQPSAIRKVAADTVDDGLLQRLFPIVLGPAVEGKDLPVPPVAQAYETMVESLYGLRTYPSRASLLFDDGAHAIRQAAERRHFEMQSAETINAKLATHVGKLDGLFARLCIVWHCIINADVPAFPTIVTEDTARRVDAFMRTFLLRHAFSFYTGTLGMADDHDAVTATAGYILSRQLTEITTRDMARGDSIMKALPPNEVLKTFERLAAFGWLDVAAGPRPSSPARGVVNPRVHELFVQRAETERRRRENVRNILANLAA